MSIVDGFRQGFGMMSQYYDQQDAKKYRQEQLGLQRRRMNMAEESHNANMETAGLNTQILQNQVNDLPAANDYRDKTRALNISTAERQNQAAGLELDITKSKKTWAEEDRKIAKANERLAMYRATGNWDGFDQDETFRGTNLELMQNEIGRQHAIALGDSLNNNDIKAAIASANGLFKSQLNRNVGKMNGRDGGVIRDISIVGIEQMEDGKSKVPVQVTTDKGVYTSYISEMRGIDPNDPERVFTGDELLGTAAAMANMARILKGSDAYKNMNEAADRALGATNSPAGQVPEEVQTISMLSQMTGISAEELVRAKYLSQKDPSGATLRKTALELAQKDPRWANLEDYADDPAKQQQMASGIISEYSGYLMQGDAAPAASNQPQPGVPTNTNELGDDPLGIRR